MSATTPRPAPVPRSPRPSSPLSRARRRTVAALGLVVAGSMVAAPACGGRDRDDRTPGLVTTVPGASTSSSTPQPPTPSSTAVVPTSYPGAAPGQGDDVDPPDPAPTPSGGGATSDTGTP